MRNAILEINREWLAPVTLSAENSVAQAEVDCPFSDAHLVYPADHCADGLFHLQAVDKVRVDQLAVFGVVGTIGNIAS